MSVCIKGTDKVFAEGFEPGVIAEQELHFDEDPETYGRPVFLAYLMDKQEEFLKEHVEVIIEDLGEQDESS